eukprot:scaffold139698_cov20-Tisochrysis_lutea.AAC.1
MGHHGTPVVHQDWSVFHAFFMRHFSVASMAHLLNHRWMGTCVCAQCMQCRTRSPVQSANAVGYSICAHSHCSSLHDFYKSFVTIVDKKKLQECTKVCQPCSEGWSLGGYFFHFEMCIWLQIQQLVEECRCGGWGAFRSLRSQRVESEAPWIQCAVAIWELGFQTLIDSTCTCVRVLAFRHAWVGCGYDAGVCGVALRGVNACGQLGPRRSPSDPTWSRKLTAL